MDTLPRWADVILIPVINLVLALLVSGLVVLYIGENPIEAIKILLNGAIGSTRGWGYTLYFATNFIFTGLAVSIAFHARLFNIGGEGQAAIGGLGVALVSLSINWPHWAVALPFAIIGGAVFGAAWAAIPAYLQARRGSHRAGLVPAVLHMPAHLAAASAAAAAIALHAGGRTGVAQAGNTARRADYRHHRRAPV